MAYNTGNPIGSTSPKDLSDNARNLDLLLLGDDPSYPDRKGVPRKSWKGMEAEYVADRLRRATEFHTAQTDREVQFKAFMDASGYEAPVPYVPGLALERATQTVTYLGNEYRVKSQFLPLSTTAWATDEPKLKLIGDDSLRQEMATPGKGTQLLAHKRSALSTSTSSLSRWLDGEAVNLWELVEYVVARPTSDPSTWDWLPALNKWVDNVLNIPNYSRSLRIPKLAGGYGVSETWHVPLSNIQVRQEADIRLTSTVRQTTILFASDREQAPASSLFGVEYIISRGVKVDGNASAMSFEYAHGDGSDNNSAVRFNRVDTFTARGGHATNGPIDSFSIRQCRNWLVEDFEFSYAKEDNGFSVTTDWELQVRGNWDTYGFGTLKSFRTHHNKDFGATAFNCSGVTFDDGKSWKNRAGYSYERAYKAAAAAKYYDGKFISCVANDCPEQGIYVDASGVHIDDKCGTGDIKGYAEPNPDGLFENGVVISGADDVYVGGKHRDCGRSGLAIFNGGAGAVLNVIVGGEYTGHGAEGIRARGVSRLRIKSGTVVKSCGNTLGSGSYCPGVRVSNSGGPGYLEGAGAFVADGVNVENCGREAIVVEYVGSVTIDNCPGADNCQSLVGSAILVSNASILFARNNHMRHSGGRQQYGLVVGSSVATAHVWGNKGPGSTSGDVANASPNRKGISSDVAISLGAYTSTGAYPSEGNWTLNSLGNALSTLADNLQRNGVINKN